MTTFHHLTKIIIITISCILLIACDNKSKPPATESIDTLNIFFANQAIFSFDPQTNKTSIRAEFNSGDNKVLPLSTNEDKQGYEYALYIQTVTDSETFEEKDNLFLFDYVTGLSRELARFDNKVCGIFPDKKAATDSIDESNNRENKFLFVDKPNVFVSVAPVAEDCTIDTERYFKISYQLQDDSATNEEGENENKLNEVSYSQVSSGNIIGSHILDFKGDTQEASVEKEIDRVAVAAFVGYDLDGQELEIYVGEKVLQVSLPSSLSIPSVAQVTNNEIFITSDSNYYIHDINNLLSFLSSDSSDTVEVPSNTVDDLFELPTGELDSLDFKLKQGKESFILEDGDSLKLLQKESSTQFNLVEFYSKSPTLIDVDYFIGDSGLILLHKMYSDHHILSKIIESENQPGEFIESTLVIAERLIVDIDKDDVYLNALNPTNVIGSLENFNGWQSFRMIVTDKVVEELYSYDNSLFLLIDNINEVEPAIMLISSDEQQNNTDYLENAQLYIYDPEENNGREKTSESESLIDAVDFSYGEFVSDSSGESTIFSRIVESVIINDIYGYVIIEDQEAQRYRYFFNPSQFDAPSLTLIK